MFLVPCRLGRQAPGRLKPRGVGEPRGAVVAHRRLTGYTIHTSVGRPPEAAPGPTAARRGHAAQPIAHGPHPLLRVAVQLRDGTWLNFRRPLSPARTIVASGLLCAAADRRAGRDPAIVVACAMRPGRCGCWPRRRSGWDAMWLAASTRGRAAPEVLAAANAFNEMQTSLRRFVEDRTQMIAAISHDLRTPITRLKLRAEFVDDDEQRGKMLADLDEMEAMIASTLAFARDDAVAGAARAGGYRGRSPASPPISAQLDPRPAAADRPRRTHRPRRSRRLRQSARECPGLCRRIAGDADGNAARNYAHHRR